MLEGKVVRNIWLCHTSNIPATLFKPTKNKNPTTPGMRLMRHVGHGIYLTSRAQVTGSNCKHSDRADRYGTKDSHVNIWVFVPTLLTSWRCPSHTSSSRKSFDTTFPFSPRRSNEEISQRVPWFGPRLGCDGWKDACRSKQRRMWN